MALAGSGGYRGRGGGLRRWRRDDRGRRRGAQTLAQLGRLAGLAADGKPQHVHGPLHRRRAAATEGEAGGLGAGDRRMVVADVRPLQPECRHPQRLVVERDRDLGDAAMRHRPAEDGERPIRGQPGGVAIGADAAVLDPLEDADLGHRHRRLDAALHAGRVGRTHHDDRRPPAAKLHPPRQREAGGGGVGIPGMGGRDVLARLAVEGEAHDLALDQRLDPRQPHPRDRPAAQPQDAARVDRGGIDRKCDRRRLAQGRRRRGHPRGRRRAAELDRQNVLVRLPVGGVQHEAQLARPRRPVGDGEGEAEAGKVGTRIGRERAAHVGPRQAEPRLGDGQAGTMHHDRADRLQRDRPAGPFERLAQCHHAAPARHVDRHLDGGDPSGRKVGRVGQASVPDGACA